MKINTDFAFHAKPEGRGDSEIQLTTSTNHEPTKNNQTTVWSCGWRRWTSALCLLKCITILAAEGSGAVSRYPRDLTCNCILRPAVSFFRYRSSFVINFCLRPALLAMILSLTDLAQNHLSFSVLL